MSTPYHTASEVTEFLTAAQLRKRWQVSLMFLWRIRRKGTLNAYKIGNGVRFALADVERIERDAMTTPKGGV